MFSFNLRRSSIQPIPTASKKVQQNTYFNPSISRQHLTLVPEAFFQQSTSNFGEKQKSSVTGILNTVDIEYPIQIQQFISQKSQGEIIAKHDIFCFIKESTIWFWRYTALDFSTKLIFHCNLGEPILAVDWELVDHPSFSQRNFYMVAIARKKYIYFYRISNFEPIRTNNEAPSLEKLNCCIKSTYFVNIVKIIHEKSESGERSKNGLLVVWGDDMGNLNLFDYSSLKKYQTYTFRLMLQEQIKKQMPYNQIKQILIQKNCLVCLREKQYIRNQSFLQKLTNFFRPSSPQTVVDHSIELYEVKLRNQFRGLNSRSVFSNAKVENFVHRHSFSSKVIFERIRSSFQGYFQDNQKMTNKEMHKISSIASYPDCFEIVFYSGDSIKMNINMSFFAPPQTPCQPPSQFGFFKEKEVKKIMQKEINDKSKLLYSNGRTIMVFKDFLIAEDHNLTYFTPFLQEKQLILRKIRKLQRKKGSNGQEILLLGINSMTLVQKMDPQNIIYLLSLAQTGCIDSNIKMMPQRKLFNELIAKMIRKYGAIQISIWILQLLIDSKLYDDHFVNLRNDLLDLAVHQISSDRPVKFQEAQRNFQNNAGGITNTKVHITQQTQDLIWTLIFQLQNQTIKTPISGGLHVQVIIKAFQLIISTIFSPMRDWSSKIFCANQQYALSAITHSKIIISILDSYVQREQIYFNRRPAMNWAPSPIAKFCQLSSASLQKLNIIVEMYMYLCEYDANSNNLPTLANLLFSYDIYGRIGFSNTVLNTLSLKNETLMDELIENIPELHLNLVRNFDAWVQTIKNEHKVPYYDLINQTRDESFEKQNIEQMVEFMNPCHYKHVEDYLLSSCRSLQQNKVGGYISRMITLFKLVTRKVIQLKEMELKASNLLANYSQRGSNYYSYLQIPNLHAKKNQIANQYRFLIDRYMQLSKQVFEGFQTKKISQVYLKTFIQSVFYELPHEVRNQIERKLTQLNLSEVIRGKGPQMFMSRHKMDNWLQEKPKISKQLAKQTIRKYI